MSETELRRALLHRLHELPGKRTRIDLLKASFPPAVAWTRVVMRLSVAGAIWAAGFPGIAKIIVVLSVVVLLATVESQIAKVVLEACKKLFRGKQ